MKLYFVLLMKSPFFLFLSLYPQDAWSESWVNSVLRQFLPNGPTAGLNPAFTAGRRPIKKRSAVNKLGIESWGPLDRDVSKNPSKNHNSLVTCGTYFPSVITCWFHRLKSCRFLVNRILAWRSRLLSLTWAIPFLTPGVYKKGAQWPKVKKEADR